MFLFHPISATTPFIPHGHCYLWKPGLVGLHIFSDAFTAIAYFSISITLLHLVRRIALPFHWIFVAFGLFIAACGATHLMAVWTLWYPTYWLSGEIKFITAIASVATAVLLPPLVPKVGVLMTNAGLAEERRLQLETTNEELATLYQRVQELNQLKTQFFTNVSHELRTPLTLLLGTTTRLLKQDGRSFTSSNGDGSNVPQLNTIPLSPQELTTIDTNARSLLKYVNDLLDIARMEVGKMDIQYVALDLAQLVRQTAANFDTLAQDRTIQFSIRTPEALPMQADTEKVQRVLLNLLANAFKFVPAGGAITCTVEQVGDRAILTVEDNGPGVPPDEQLSIFERFQQGNRRSAQSGTGLGLAIAKEFVELHQGTICVTNGRDGGAHFRVELPLVAPLDTTIHPSAPTQDITAIAQATLLDIRTTIEPPALPLQSPLQPEETLPILPLILVVEDNPDMRRFIYESLVPYYRVMTAVNGQDGLEQAIAQPPDLILTDLMMPEMDGAQFVHQIRSRTEFDLVPVILLTARADLDLQVRLLQEGAQDYLTKPFSEEELHVRIDNLITVKQVREVLQLRLVNQMQNVATLKHRASASQQELQRALTALHQSEARFRRLWEAGMIGIIFWDIQGNILDANHTFLDMIGYTHTDLDKRHLRWSDLTPPEYADLDEQALAAIRTRGVCEPFEKEYIHKRGDRISIMLGGAFLEGSQEQGISFVLDITARKQAERALQRAHDELEQRVQQRTEELSQINHQLQREIAERMQSEENLRVAQRIAHLGSWMIDWQTQTMQWSEEMFCIFGRSLALPPSLEDYHHQIYPEDRPLWHQMTAAALQDGVSREFDLRIVRPDQSLRYIVTCCQPLMDEAGQGVRLLGTVMDISDRKRAELEIQTLNAELEQRVAERTTQLEIANVQKDELLRREKAARTEAEVANRMKDEFLATLSHELRTPLNSILGWAQLLRTRTFDKATTAQALETIERNARSQSQLVGDILDVSRIIRGKIRLNRCLVRLSSLIAVALDSVRPAADAKGIILHSTITSDIEPISGDPERLQQVLWNLLSNAIKFTPPNGQVEITLTVTPAGHLLEQRGTEEAVQTAVSSSPANTYARITVTDSGEGISPEFLPYVFDRFRQADGTTQRPHGGLGLGLAIVRHLVELHGGTVAASSPGLHRGATFTVCLPIRQDTIRQDTQDGLPSTTELLSSLMAADSAPDHAAAQAIAPSLLPASPPPAGSSRINAARLDNLHILVVDDEADTRDFLTLLLEQSGARVTAVGAVTAAIEVLMQDDREQVPDILISDIGMPVQDGYAMIRQARAIAQSRDLSLPAIALTAYASTDDRIKLLQAGFQMHIPKPVDPTELVAAIASLGGRVR